MLNYKPPNIRRVYRAARKHMLEGTCPTGCVFLHSMDVWRQRAGALHRRGPAHRKPPEIESRPSWQTAAPPVRGGSARLWSGASVRHPGQMPCSRLSIGGRGGAGPGSGCPGRMGRGCGPGRGCLANLGPLERRSPRDACMGNARRRTCPEIGRDAPMCRPGGGGAGLASLCRGGRAARPSLHVFRLGGVTSARHSACPWTLGLFGS